MRSLFPGEARPRRDTRDNRITRGTSRCEPAASALPPKPRLERDAIPPKFINEPCRTVNVFRPPRQSHITPRHRSASPRPIDAKPLPCLQKAKAPGSLSRGIDLASPSRPAGEHLLRPNQRPPLLLDQLQQRLVGVGKLGRPLVHQRVLELLDVHLLVDLVQHRFGRQLVDMTLVLL